MDAAHVLEQLRLSAGLGARAPLEAPRGLLPTRLSELDALLGGGFPHTVTEIVGARSSGRTTLAHAVAASVTAMGALVACVDLADAFDAERAALAGVYLSRLLWIRPRDVRTALRATESVVTAGGFRLVLLDVATCVPGPPTVWLRLARAARRTGTAVVVLGERRMVGAFATLSLEVCRQHASFTPQGGPCPLFDGLDGQVRMRKSKYAPLHAAGARLVATATT